MKKLFKQIAREQYSRIVDSAVGMLDIRQPKEGWIKTVRMALGMSGPQLAKRLGSSRSITSYLERSELDGGVTLRKMQNVAEAMGCRFVYAIVPETSIDDLIEKQALKKAEKLASEASTHMMLEDQALDDGTLEKEKERLKNQIINELNKDLWSDL
ncbi:MAG: mobile mystery protein A [Gammaproteobacteria bacterium]|nr:mobile mystery protein A [Gammaproteobacteria bacterium]